MSFFPVPRNNWPAFRQKMSLVLISARMGSSPKMKYDSHVGKRLINNQFSLEHLQTIIFRLLGKQDRLVT